MITTAVVRQLLQGTFLDEWVRDEAGFPHLAFPFDEDQDGDDVLSDITRVLEKRGMLLVDTQVEHNHISGDIRYVRKKEQILERWPVGATFSVGFKVMDEDSAVELIRLMHNMEFIGGCEITHIESRDSKDIASEILEGALSEISRLSGKISLSALTGKWEG